MSAIEDSLGALVAYLAADATVSGLVGSRVYGLEMPLTESDGQPRKAVVLHPSGGVVPVYAEGKTPLEVYRVDVWCYGETGFQANRLRRAVYGALKSIERTRQGSVLLHWCKPAGGLMFFRDQSLHWPVAWQSWQLQADERTAA